MVNKTNMDTWRLRIIKSASISNAAEETDPIAQTRASLEALAERIAASGPMIVLKFEGQAQPPDFPH
jgi:hypothetical protein